MHQSNPDRPTSAVTGPGGDDPGPVDVYALGADQGESARLQRQADELAPESTLLLDRVDLRPGNTAIDLGCGPRGVLELLWERVAPGGRVVGLDADPTHVAMARTLVAERGLTNAEVVAGDARDSGLPTGSVDLVHARTLLITVPEPVQVLAEMVRLARPAGWVVGLEPDAQWGLCYPANSAYDRLCALFPLVFARNGADLQIGRRLSELYRQAGLKDVQLEVAARLYPPGHSRRTLRLDLVRSLRSQIVQLGLADEPELVELDAAARAHLADPRTVVMPHLNFLVWGRKPPDS